MDTLIADATATHHGLAERLARARVSHASPEAPRAQYADIDTYLAASSRHLGATLQVLVPLAASRLPDGARRAGEYVDACRRHEEALACVKAKLYRAARTAHDPWSRVWHETESSFRWVWGLELALVRDLAPYLHPGERDWAQEMHGAELRAPTRPHPHIPHRGFGGRAARVVARTVDSFFDTAEGRMAPAPLKVHDRENDGPLAQYLLGDPHLTPGPEKVQWAPEPRRAREVQPDTE